MEPHYAQPLPQLHEYTNREQDIIRQAFQAGNFSYLANLPATILPSAVSNVVEKKCEENVTKPLRAKPQTCHLWGCPGLIHEFEWMPDDYNRFAEQKSRDRIESETKRMMVSQTDFIPSSSAKKEKYEDGFSKTTVQFASINDNYKDDMVQMPPHNWLREGGSSNVFKPALHEKGIAESHHGHLPEIASHLTERLRNDWEEVSVQVTVNPEELIEVRFEESTVDNPKGLHTYMNVMTNKDPIISEWQLRRVAQNWGFSEDGFIYYQLAPHWKALKSSDAFYTINSSMATKASFYSEGAQNKPRKPTVYSYHTSGRSTFLTDKATEEA
mmetsp:Transcript_9463/g.18245  ORF Transcript_9463/g.18245 Transcript_9463/m.18245 type:complete len:327 (-) Transcript_9463:2132-3112(-)